MIDLHIHTTYSDGIDTVKELLEKVENFYEMEKFNVKEIYKGEIIVGCEFTTNFDNRFIEVLGNGFNYKKVNKYLEKKYNFLNDKKRFKCY